MTEQDKLYFKLLHDDRSESADMLEKPSLSGIKGSVVEKYSDQAHFIYELLQNADDVQATTASFELYSDKLVFKHNGKRHFFLSDPRTEKEDTANRKLGDLNAITSVANSNKGNASIGKFGVGFKAVFQYTETPCIFDPDIAFRIERFIVPVQIENNYPGRKNDETVFVFPFDHKARSPKEAYEDIAEKLKNLVFPNLFIKNLSDISFEIDSTIGLYGKTIEEEKVFGDITAQKINHQHNVGDDIVSDKLWLFSRKDENDRDYCVGFFIDEKEKLKPISMPAFCFFPTKEVTNLNFIVHAPFLLTDSREGIKAGESYNKNLISQLAKLAADSLQCLCEIGNNENIRYIDDSILDIVPFDKTVFTSITDKSKISFLPFYDSILKKFKEEKLIPSFNEYCYAENACMASSLVISDLFSNEQLGQLTNNSKARWAFASVNWDAIKRLHNGQDDYLRELLPSIFDTIDSIVKLIDKEFIAKQNFDWLIKLYAFLCENTQRVERYKTYPIFIDNNGNPVSAYDESGNLTLFLNDGKSEGYATINDVLYANEETQKILHFLKVGKPELKDRIYNKILKKILSMV